MDYDKMIESIRKVDENEVAEMIEKVLKVFRKDEEEYRYDDFYEAMDYIDCIEIMNEKLRHDNADSWVLYATDYLERNEMWLPGEEFNDCLRKVYEYIDDIFLWVADELYE